MLEFRAGIDIAPLRRSEELPVSERPNVPLGCHDIPASFRALVQSSSCGLGVHIGQTGQSGDRFSNWTCGRELGRTSLMSHR